MLVELRLGDLPAKYVHILDVPKYGPRCTTCEDKEWKVIYSPAGNEVYRYRLAGRYGLEITMADWSAEYCEIYAAGSDAAMAEAWRCYSRARAIKIVAKSTIASNGKLE